MLSEGYLYVLDTVTFSYTFPTLFSQFNFRIHPQVIYASPLPCSNMYAFSMGVVESYGTTFEQPVSKREGLFIEFNHGSVRGVKSLINYGSVVECLPRQLIDRRRMYMTNVSGGLGVRYTLYYPSFGVFKHVRWGAPMALCRARNNCTRHTKALQLQLSDGTGFMSKLPAEVGASCPVPPSRYWCKKAGMASRC